MGENWGSGARASTGWEATICTLPNPETHSPGRLLCGGGRRLLLWQPLGQHLARLLEVPHLLAILHPAAAAPAPNGAVGEQPQQ